MKKTLLCFVILFTFSVGMALAAPPNTQIQYEKGIVLSVSPLNSSGQESPIAGKGELVKIKLTSGPEIGQEVNSINYRLEQSAFTSMNVSPGDRIIVAITNDSGATQYNISDFERTNYVYILLGIFILSLLIFGGIVGIKSVIVIGFSCFLIFKIFIAQVLSFHTNITLLVFIISAVIAIVTQTFISGWTVKTRAAILGSVGGVAIAGILSNLAIHFMHLTGLESEEAMMLKATLLPTVDFQGILFAGMVLGSLGAVMDVTISIASAVNEVRNCMQEIKFKPLFLTGMNVGRDIMGTMSNTLILAYAGSSLPLILLISAQKDISSIKIMNLNLIVTEIVRALTGSIGLICAIPLTAFFSAILFRDKSSRLLRRNQIRK
ncbi:putative membrane protein [Sporomusaceae bacterium BoRhaA]|uniref:YibE/F family protein n=1 Tax=Pelorhabdus rhamnosifermentans TaxID=2772457 RepID=UPI001FE4A485|nr:YibE/F family protein [Pelorhabdus rhamnosifermentans]MBU2700311.1 putative membrane protein [Pelorhabdus rhamnosifermentans]